MPPVFRAAVTCTQDPNRVNSLLGVRCRGSCGLSTGFVPACPVSGELVSIGAVWVLNRRDQQFDVSDLCYVGPSIIVGNSW